MKTKQRYVYFDKKTGMITDILSVRKRGRAKYVTVDVDDVIPFINGTKGLFESIVVYNRDTETYNLVERNNIIKLRYYGEKLYKIPKKNMVNYDIKIEIYTEGNTMEITIDPSRMSSLYATDFRDEIKFEKGTEIRLYIKNKVGEKLLKTIIIDAQKLLDQGQMFFDLHNIDLNDISFYTHRIFDNFMWQKGTMKFMSPVREKLMFEIQKADHRRKREDYEYHLVITQYNEGIEIINNIENPKLVKIFDEIEFFIVDKYDPTVLYDKFIIPTKAFKNNHFFIKTKETLKGKGILYNHKYISVLIEE